MKYPVSPSSQQALLLTSLLSFSCLLGGASLARAHDDNHDGFRDHDGHYHHYEYHHHHRGYWNNQGGTRLWINI